MKKTFFIALISAWGSSTFAATTTFTDLGTSVTIDGYAYDAATRTLTSTDTAQSPLFTAQSGQNAQTSISFTLNLTEAAKVNTKTALLTIDSGTDYGLWITANGISGRWGDNEFNNNSSNSSSTGVVSIASILANNNNVFTLGTDQYITLTLTADKTQAHGGNGLQLYDASGNVVYNCTGLGASGNTSFSGFTFSELIGSAALTPEKLTATTAGETAQALQQKLVPEPATVTLSLFALAGLAARRRRQA